MRKYQCDNCETLYVSEPPVVLKGIKPAHEAGLLIPQSLHEKTFCSPACFWTYIEKTLPLVHLHSPLLNNS